MCTIEQAGAGVKIGGAVGGLVGTGMVIGGTIKRFFDKHNNNNMADFFCFF